MAIKLRLLSSPANPATNGCDLVRQRLRTNIFHSVPRSSAHNSQHFVLHPHQEPLRHFQRVSSGQPPILAILMTNGGSIKVDQTIPKERTEEVISCAPPQLECVGSTTRPSIGIQNAKRQQHVNLHKSTAATGRRIKEPARQGGRLTLAFDTSKTATDRPNRHTYISIANAIGWPPVGRRYFLRKIILPMQLLW